MIIFALVLNYKTKNETLECVKSLKKNKLPSNVTLKIVIVDNASNDGIERALSKDHKDVICLQTGSNLGYTGGNNSGIRWILQTMHDEEKKKKEDTYILILNNDTTLDEKCIDELVKAYRRHPKAGVISPKIYFDPNSLPAKVLNKDKEEISTYDKNKIIWSAGGLIDWNNIYGSTRGVDQYDQGQYDEDTQIDFASGTSLFIPFSIVNQLKEFDNNYFMYYEDVDFSLRIKKLGYEIWYVSKAILWHKNASSSGMASPLQDYFITRNRLYFGLKYASLRTKFALVREALRFRDQPNKWHGVKDFFSLKWGKGTFIKS
jgi:GT2 family glycosyltransferase